MLGSVFELDPPSPWEVDATTRSTGDPGIGGARSSSFTREKRSRECSIADESLQPSNGSEPVAVIDPLV